MGFCQFLKDNMQSCLKVPSSRTASRMRVISVTTSGPDGTDSGLYARKWLAFYRRPGHIYAEDISSLQYCLMFSLRYGHDGWIWRSNSQVTTRRNFITCKLVGVVTYRLLAESWYHCQSIQVEFIRTQPLDGTVKHWCCVCKLIVSSPSLLCKIRTSRSVNQFSCIAI